MYIQAPFKGTRKDVIAAWYRAVIGQSPISTTQAASNQLVHALWNTKVGLVVDEVHYTGDQGIQAIRFVHDQVAAMYQHRVPIVLIGAKLDVILAESGGEMVRRAPFRAKFQALAESEIAAILPTMNPRFAQMDPRLITIINDKYGHGLLGMWANVAVAAEDLPGSGPLNKQDIADVLMLLGSAVMVPECTIEAPSGSDPTAITPQITETPDGHSSSQRHEKHRPPT